MRSVLVRRMSVLLVALTLMGGAAFAEGTTTPAVERVVLGTGCAQGTGGTCATTEYWLGKTGGQNNVGTTGSFTPLSYAFRAAGAEVAYATFAGNETLAPSYALRTDTPLTGRVNVTGYSAGAELAADSTVRVVLSATRVDNQDFVTLGEARVNKAAVTPSLATPDSKTYSYSITLPAELENVAVQDLSLELFVDSVSVLGNGFVDGKGGSYLDLPYYAVAPAL